MSSQQRSQRQKRCLIHIFPGSAAFGQDCARAAQGKHDVPPPAQSRQVITAPADGRIREIDCREIARVAKRAGAPANASAGVRLHKTVGDVVRQGEPLFEIHAQSETQLEFGRAYAEAHPELVRFGF